MVDPHETFNGTFPFEPRFSEAAGFRMHYVEEGSGEPVLLLHGEPTWGYMFRELIQALRTRHRVIAPDHMGFGKSETPRGRAYDLAAHIDNLEALILDLDLWDITVVGHDFGGSVAAGVALRHPERFARLVAANAGMPLGLDVEGGHLRANIAEAAWFQWIVRAHADGSLDAVLGNLDATILSILKLNGFARHERIDETWLAAYAAPFVGGAPAAAGAIGWALGVAEGTLRFEVGTPEAVAAVRAKPAMLIYGMLDRTLRPEHFIPMFEEAFPAAPVHRIEGAGHYVFEDAPETVAPLIEQFVALTPVAAIQRG
jgi:cis-3-alkyl-4-acyloxetan-2-one decarboxylase